METLIQLELTFTLFVQGLGEGFVPIMKFFSFLGTEEFYLVMIPLLLWVVDARIGIRIAVMLILTNATTSVLKLAFHSPRPYWIDSNVKAYASESSFGLPSGHAQNAATLWGLLAALISKWWVTILTGIVIFMIGFSRIFLGVHFTHDVLTGWVVGIILVFVFIVLEKPVSAWFSKTKFGWKLLFALLVSAVIMLIGYGTRWSLGDWAPPQEWIANASQQWPDATINPLDLESFVTISAISFGFILGLALLSVTGNRLRTDGNWLQKTARYLLGMIGLLALYLGLRMIFPSEPEGLAQVFRFVRYALIGTWVTFGAPWIFIKLKLIKES
jgi:membrane-associated phospholipid phosphatase